MSQPATSTVVVPPGDHVWFDPAAGQPEVPAQSLGLFFTIRPADSESGATLALLGAYRLSWPYLQLYGGQLPAPIHVVAVGATDGVVRHALPMVADEEPFRILMSDEAVAAVPEAARGARVATSRFNVDLCALLGLPLLGLPRAGAHHVFLVLDELTSEMATVDAPPLGALPANPRAEARPVWSAPSGELLRQRVVLPPEEGPGSPVTVLAFGHRSGTVRWHAHSFVGPRPAAIDVDLASLFDVPAANEKTFVLIVAGGALSTVLVVPPAGA